MHPVMYTNIIYIHPVLTQILYLYTPCTPILHTPCNVHKYRIHPVLYTNSITIHMHPV